MSDRTFVPTPVPGHDYIEALTETVNPANGSVSLRLKTPTPSGRGLSLPFAFTYDSNAVHFPTANGPNIDSAMGYSGGWVYSVPLLSKFSETSYVQTTPNVYQPCWYTDSNVFREPSGGSHSFFGMQMYPDPNPCPYILPHGASGNDHFYQARAEVNGDTRVSGADGTVYDFTSPWGSQASDTTPDFKIPNWIEDRNGNIITVSGTSWSSFSYTDTLGRTLVSASLNNVSIAGLSSPYMVTWETSYSNFNPGGFCVHPFPNETQSVIQSISLPNGKQYQFMYETTYGLLKQITYPTGATIKYTWQFNAQSQGGEFQVLNPYPTEHWDACADKYGMPALQTRVVSFDGVTDALEQDFTYSTTWSSTPIWSSKHTTVVTKDLLRNITTQVQYDYLPQWADNNNQVQAPVEQSIQYQDGSGTTIRTVTKDWYNADALKSVQVTLDNGQTSETSYTYLNQIGVLPTEVDEYDFAQGTPGPLLRKTVTTYQTFSNTPIYPTAPSIINRPSGVITYGSDGTTRVAETDYAYDQTSVSGVSNLPAGTHDETNYSATSTAPRGNATTITRQCFPSCANAVTTYTYDETGQVLTSKDANLNATQYSYADNFDTPPSSNTNAYLTQITDPLSHVSKFKYAYSDGKLIQSQDPNDIDAGRSGTTYVYNDQLRRLTETDYPDGGQTTYAYNESAYPFSLTTTKKLTGTSNLVTKSVIDGLGHVTQTLLNSDPECSTGDKTDTTYDGLGRVNTVSNPYCSTSDPTYGLTTYTYDALGRTCVVVPPAGTPQSNCPTGAIAGDVVTVYAGRASQVFDEGNGTQSVTRISQTDGLGRLPSVCEVSSTSLIGSGGTPVACGQDIAATGFLTTYQYDALDNLIQVNQSGIAARTFAYDSLSRLTSATNPESGTTGYTYDANGNVITKADARNITTCFGDWNGATSTCNGSTGYDALNRVLKKTYSDGTPTVQFGYDTQNMTIGTLHITATNFIGRLSWESTLPYPGSYTQTSFSYDSMGRINHLWSCQNVSCSRNPVDVSYSYDLIGNETDRNLGTDYASAYNTAGRLISLTQTNYTDTHNPANLLSGAQYDAFGHMTFANLGNGLSETWQYDNRGRLQSEAAGTGCSAGTCSVTKYSVTKSYTPNGDVHSANDSVEGNWAYGYDAFNRLTCSNLNSSTCPPTSGTPTYTYEYDRFGNRWHQNGPYSMNLTFTGNRIDGYSYDAAGNLLNDNNNHTYTYDAENRITSVDNGATGYFYDGAGRRLEKSANGTPTFDYFYGQDSGVLIIIQPSAPLYQEIYAGGMHLATHTLNPAQTGTDTYFHHSDWLGTERARTDYAGNLCETITSLPFGDGQTVTSTCLEGDVSPMHFTGKERDSETGLDNFVARYNSSDFGRFISPDPLAGHTEDPQTLDRYTYVRNNPLNLTDPTGLDFYLSCTPTPYNTKQCQPVQTDPHNKKSIAWVQTDQNGYAQIVTSDSIRAGNNSAVVGQNGVEVTTGGKTYQGIYFDNPDSIKMENINSESTFVDTNPITLSGKAGSDLENFSFFVNGNCGGTCLASGTFDFNSTPDQTRNYLDAHGAFRSIVDRTIPLWGASIDEEIFHPNTTQHRFGEGPSLHVSVPRDPRATVPTMGLFHVDKDAPGLRHLGCATLGVGCH